MKEYLSNARLPGESFEDYRERRKRANWAVKQVTKYVNGRPSSITKDGFTFKVTYTKGGPVVHRHTAAPAQSAEDRTASIIDGTPKQPEAWASAAPDPDGVADQDA